MDRVLPQARVTGYAGRIPAIALPDSGDRHVVAAAAEAGASIITRGMSATSRRPSFARRAAKAYPSGEGRLSVIEA